jgi:hypothetical protein
VFEAQRLAAIAAMSLILPAIASRQDPQTVEPGETILSAACLTCHDHRHVDTQALDEAGWTKVVKAEIDRGAKVSADDRPVLVDYLVRHHGPVPEGPGREILLNVCTQCHDLTRIQRQGRTPEGWLEVLDAMLNEGAPLPEQDLPTILRYLARNFKPR